MNEEKEPKKRTTKKTTTKKTVKNGGSQKKTNSSSVSKKTTTKKKTTVNKKPKKEAKIEIKKEPVVVEKQPKEEIVNPVETKKSKKKWIIILICLVSLIALTAATLAISLSGKKTDTNTVKIGKSKVKITKNEASKITYEKYDNGLVSFEQPKGWKVEVAPVDYIHYSFKVYNPEDPTYMFIFAMKMEGSLKSEKARKVYAKYYPDAVFAKVAAIDPQTTEAFYKVWNHNMDLNNKDFGYDFFPHLDNFTVVENLGKDMVGGDILRATYTDSNGKTAQGLFTAAVKSMGSYYISEDIWNPFGKQVDVSPLNIYNIMVLSAPDADFINWQSILNHCISTINFSESFINGFNREEDSILKTVQANQKIYDQISDMIMDSWEKRNASYDIISQKQSDATLGYERVYDTETGDIYKADLGFMDHDWNGRYESVTDEMYNKPTSGYIEKIN